MTTITASQVANSLAISKSVYDFADQEYWYYAEDWQTLRDCLAGERAIKERGERYLPKMHGHEQHPQRYAAHLRRATFFNACARTVDGLVGAIFRRPPTWGNTTPALRSQLNWTNRLTKAGDPFEIAAREAARETIAMGRYGLFLDRGTAPGDPLFVATYPAENILTYEQRVIHGQLTTSLVVLLERNRVRDPASPLVWKNEETVRVLELDENNEYCQWIHPHPEARTYPTRRGQRLNFIPFIFMGPNHLRPQIQKSLILDIARLNVSHYRSYAALEHGRHFTAMPVYVAKYDADNPGAQDAIDTTRDEPTYYLDADTVWEMSSEDDAKILEYSGSGLRYLETALETKESQIQSLGGRLIAANRGAPAQSAAALEIQSLGEASMLLSVSNNLSVAFSQLMQWWAWWEDLLPGEVLSDPEQQPYVKFPVNFNENKITPREIRAMQTLYKSGIMPVDALYHSFREAGVIPADMSLEDYRTLLNDPAQVPTAVDHTTPQPPAGPLAAAAANGNGNTTTTGR